MSPRVLVEPTCGTGTFLLAALKTFASIETVYGVEIYRPHLHAAEQALSQRAHDVSDRPRPEIHLFHADAFRFDFARHCDAGGEVLVLGNPPWVTSAELTTLDAANLPPRRKAHASSGLAAMTGQSNYDLGEAVLQHVLEAFGRRRGHVALLVKDAVVKRLVHDLPDTQLRVGDLAAFSIDANKHFDASVAASLLVGRLGLREEAPVCSARTLEAPGQGARVFGWTRGRFVADVDRYERVAAYDGRCPFEWRQGLKHDCARVMELTPEHDAYTNGLGQTVSLEPDLLFPLAKSADLQQDVVDATRKHVVVTQTHLTDDTATRLAPYPLLRRYLEAHRDAFDRRRSRVYRGKPPFALFGVGPYAFQPFKVAISGFYKKPHFAFVPPIDGKPVMLDDTCYYLAFDDETEARAVCQLLNDGRTLDLLDALAFKDAKRPFTKRILMRVDLGAIGAARGTEA